MKKRKFPILMSLAIATGTMLSACGQGATPAPDPAPAPGSGGTPAEEVADFSVHMVTDTGGIDDKSFNASAWVGLQRFEQEHGVKIGYVPSSSDSDYQPNLNRLVREGNDLILAIGFRMADDLKVVSGQQPDAQFAIVDSVVQDDAGNLIDNIANITFKEHEGSFLVGVAAAMQTKTNKVGFLGGMEFELIKKFENGFKAGVHSVNPDIEVMVQYAQDFGSVDKGRSIADVMYSNGADVIYHAAGGTGGGLFTEAKNRKKEGQDVWAIGVDMDQHEEGLPENIVLTSMVKRVDEAVFQVAEKTLNGDFQGGQIIEFGLADEGVGIAPTTENLSAEILEAVEDYKAQILNGDIEVPSTDEQFEAFKQ